MKKLVALQLIAMLAVLQLNAQSVWGYVNYFDNPLYPIEGVTVKLYNMSDDLQATTVTDGNGYYVFNNVSGTQFKIKALTDLPGYNANIVTANDILMFLNGEIEFNTWQYIAADVDGNGEVNMNDYQFIAVNHYLFGEAFPAGNWLFSEGQIDLIVNAGGGPTGLVGSRIGDIEGIFILTGRESAEPRIQFSNHINATAGTRLTIPLELISAGDISAYGLSLAYNPEIMTVVALDASLGFGGYSLQDGLIRISSLGAAAKENQVLNIDVLIHKVPESQVQPFRVLSESHLIDGSGKKLGSYTVRMPVFGQQVSKPSIQLLPNPARENTGISFTDLPSGIYTIQILSSAGQVVLSHQLVVSSTAKPVLLPIDSFERGIYVVRASNNETGLEVSARLIKM
jgi:hypothetical protein